MHSTTNTAMRCNWLTHTQRKHTIRKTGTATSSTRIQLLTNENGNFLYLLRYSNRPHLRYAMHIFLYMKMYDLHPFKYSGWQNLIAACWIHILNSVRLHPYYIICDRMQKLFEKSNAKQFSTKLKSDFQLTIMINEWMMYGDDVSFHVLVNSIRIVFT